MNSLSEDNELILSVCFSQSASVALKFCLDLFHFDR